MVLFNRLPEISPVQGQERFDHCWEGLAVVRQYSCICLVILICRTSMGQIGCQHIISSNGIFHDHAKILPISLYQNGAGMEYDHEILIAYVPLWNSVFPIIEAGHFHSQMAMGDIQHHFVNCLLIQCFSFNKWAVFKIPLYLFIKSCLVYRDSPPLDDNPQCIG